MVATRSVRVGLTIMSSVVKNGEVNLYEALFQLAQSISGHEDLRDLCKGLATSLKPVVDVDYLGLVLYDQRRHLLRLGAITGVSDEVSHTTVTASADDDPGAWVWQHQKPVVIPDFAVEKRWSAFVSRVGEAGSGAVMMFPLTTGSHRVGVLVFGKQNVYEPSDIELAFLSRVASESAVTLHAYQIQQELRRQRDRLQLLLSINNAFVSKLAPDQLFPSVCAELQKVIEHDVVAITVCVEPGKLELAAIHFVGDAQCELPPPEPASPEGLPSGEALRTGEPVVVGESDWGRYPSPLLRTWVDAGFKNICCVPLITRNGAVGTLELGRRSAGAFTEEEVDLCVQIAGQFAIATENALAYRQLAELKEKLATEKLYLESEIRLDQNLANMIGDSPAFRALLKSAEIVAPTSATVLVLGETGTGKELIARAIHDMSERRNRTFVKVNCPAIPATLLESELFGHEKGAFTGAVAQKVGRFELADHGTLFLDEVGEIPLELQSKLLRAIQEQEFERVGGNRTIRVDIRVIAATNRDLKAMVEEGKFRSDLYYRLHVFPLDVPPLRERKPDIPLLVRYFTQKYAQRMNRQIESIPSAALEELGRYDWPGNIRELQNLIERSVILTQGSVLQVVAHESRSRSALVPVRGSGPSEERAMILRALREANGVVGGPKGAAARLGLKRTTLQSRMRKLKIGREYR